MVIPSRFSNSYKGVIVVENCSEGIIIKQTTTAGRSLLDLTPPVNNKEPLYPFCDYLSLEQFAAKLEHLDQTGELKDLLVVLGSDCDPLLPGIEKIKNGVEIISLFKRYRSAHTIVQTRSPHILLAAGLLSQEKGYFYVNIPLETLSESTSKVLTPTLPLPTERLAALQTLHHLGVATACSVFPISTRPQRKEDVAQLANTLSSLTQQWYLLTPPQFDTTDTTSQLQKLAEKFHPLYDWQMAHLIKQHLLTMHNIQTNQHQHLTSSQEESRIAA